MKKVGRDVNTAFVSSNIGLVWMRMYSSQSIYIEVDWNEIKLSFTPTHVD
jgi:hypothetical protein